MPRYRVAVSIVGVIQVEAESPAKAEVMASQIVPVFLGAGERLTEDGLFETVAKPILGPTIAAKCEGPVEDHKLHPVSLHHKHGVTPG